MRELRWGWPILLLAALLLALVGSYFFRENRKLDVVVLDKTVPFEPRIEHRSLFWLLNHLKIVHTDGRPYDRDRDYLGAFPGPVPGDPPERTVDLTRERAVKAELLYLADTYGVYREDLESGEAMKAALERSPKIYGGLTIDEANAVAAAVSSGVVVIAEFNTLASPTPDDARAVLERALGVRWTRWIGRYFAQLESRDEVPAWMRRDYEREWRRPWSFSGPGYVLLQDDAHCEVLRVGEEAERIALTLERERPIDDLLAGASDGTSYPYWLDVVETSPEARTLASFQWHLTESGRTRLKVRGLPERFAAVTRRVTPRAGAAYYFAGDFADNPMPDEPVPLAGYLTLRKWMEFAKLSPSELAFYWRFYVPMMVRLTDSVAR
jgi:hypothetical protein